MQIKINGKIVDIKTSENITLDKIIESKALNCNNIVVEHNMRIVPKEEWQDTVLKQDDNIEIVSFVGGG